MLAAQILTPHGALCPTAITQRTPWTHPNRNVTNKILKRVHYYPRRHRENLTEQLELEDTFQVSRCFAFDFRHVDDERASLVIPSDVLHSRKQCVGPRGG